MPVKVLENPINNGCRYRCLINDVPTTWKVIQALFSKLGRLINGRKYHSTDKDDRIVVVLFLFNVSNINLCNIDVKHDYIEWMKYEAQHVKPSCKRVPFVWNQIVHNFGIKDLYFIAFTKNFWKLLTFIFNILLSYVRLFIQNHIDMFIQHWQHVDIVINFENTFFLLIIEICFVHETQTRENGFIMLSQFENWIIVGP